MTDRIKNLRIQNFRGATQTLDLAFDDSKPVVLIFGENGTGKSTIVDAIECVGSGTTAFLDDWKLGKGKRKESYIPALGKNLSDVSISLQFGNNTYTAKLGSRGLQLCDTANRPDVKVLRRKSLQAFIDADPAQRYKEVAAFLDIPQIEASEASLRAAYTEKKRTYEFASKANTQALEHLHGLWEAEGSPGLNGNEQGKNAEAWARKQAKAEMGSLEQELTSLKAGVKLIESLSGNKQSRTHASLQVELANTELQRADVELQAVESDAIKSNAQLVALLEDAKDYLTATPDTLCPVCEETEIEPGNLVQRLDSRLSGMAKLKQASDVKNKAQSNLTAKTALLKQAEESLLNAAEAVQAHFNQQEKQLSVKEKKESDLPEAVKLALSLNTELSTREEEQKVKLDKVQKQCHTLTSIKQLVATLDEKSTEAKEAELQQKRLGQAVVIVEEKRKAYVKKILVDIAESVDALYQQIHPKKNIGHIKLKLDEQQRGSLVYGVAFGGKEDVHPQPYYSESHLDTLGLCIFLALAKRSSSDSTIVVLDDVLGSVDQQHLNLSIEMLLQESNSFAQLVITTHYRPLRDRFRFARNPSAPVQLIELKAWNFDQGIRSGKTLSYVQELKEKMAEDDFSRDVVVPLAGQLFENLLEFISRTYRCKVPHAIEPRFTFGELANAPNKELKKALKVLVQTNEDENSEAELAPIYEKLESAINVRNLVGCHFNEWAGELADQDVREMAELALEFADILICQQCGSLPVSDKSGSYWECSCKRIQMQPLQQPKK